VEQPLLDDFVTRRLSAQDSAINKLRDQFVQQQSEVAAIGVEVDERAVELSGAQAALQEAIASRDQLVKDARAAELAANDAETTLDGLRADEQRLRILRDSLRTDLETKREAVDAARVVLDGVALACGGATYATCTDVAAKLDYDRRRYDANKALVLAREAYQKSSDASMDAADQLFQISPKIGEAQEALFEARRSRESIKAAARTAETLIAEREKVIRGIEASVQPLLDAFATLDAQAKDLATLLVP
jgi:chromosome segregation ATPase